MIPSYFCWNHFMASSFVSRCWKPTLPVLRRLWETLNPKHVAKRNKKKTKNVSFKWNCLCHSRKLNCSKSVCLFSTLISDKCVNSDIKFSRKWVISCSQLDWENFGGVKWISVNLPNYVRIETNSDMSNGIYLGGPRQRRSPNRRYRLMDRIWCPNRCVPEYRNRSCRWLRSCHVSIRIHAPKTKMHNSIRTRGHLLTPDDNAIHGIACVSFVCKSLSNRLSKRLLQIEGILSGMWWPVTVKRHRCIQSTALWPTNLNAHEHTSITHCHNNHGAVNLFTLRPRSKISSALAPRTVQWTAIFSLRRIPNERTV